jgi:hypothetical protein
MPSPVPDRVVFTFEPADEQLGFRVGYLPPAVLAWTIGLSEKQPFNVTSAGSPPRLTIEIG